ncbi:MAG: EamA family transporter [Butyrivibrio sp.]|nr:EamA family transporter [Butyrivibrio sp.]
MSGVSFGLIILGVTLNTVAQLCLKQGMVSMGAVSLELAGLLDFVIKAATSPFIMLGLSCYVASFAVWLVVLSRVEVSMAYPMLSIGYIATAAFGYCFWGESLGVYKMTGILLICAGVVVMFQE